MARVAMIYAAAGASRRFGGKVKKAFALMEDRPVFIRSIELFINRDDCCQHIVVVAPEDLEMVKTKYAANLALMGVKAVAGGAERHESVANALKEVDEQADLVGIHDAVRPCVTEQWVDAVFAEAGKSGAAILAAPLYGTIKRVSDAKVVDETLLREGLYEAQTPQVFKRQVILDAYERIDRVDGPITDDAQLVEAMGHPVSVVESDISNLKITRPDDVRLAVALIKSRPKKRVGPRGPFEEAQW